MVSVPLPEWVKDIRPHQQQAVDEIVEAFATNDVVFLDAPTGSGKTLIAEMVRREMNRKCLYVCSDIALMNQFARDFDYAKLLMGRGNYPTQNNSDMTADDCTSKGPTDPCWWCDAIYMCPYQVAKEAALAAPLAVTNTSFLLSEANYVGRFSGQQLIVADEADTLEKILMGFIEFNVSERRIKDFGMTPPAKGAHKPTLVKWLDEFSSKCVVAAMREPDPKKQRGLMRMEGDSKRVSSELSKEIAKNKTQESEGKWLRDYKTGNRDGNGGLVLKPVMVDSFGTRNLWRHGRKWLLMSATIISSDEMADSLGLPLNYSTVTVPMTFPVENRQVIVAPVANVVYKEMDTAKPRLVKAILRILEKHPTERVLIHTVSYKLATELQQMLRSSESIGKRRVLTYSNGKAKEATLAQYKRTKGCVMLAPSMSRGVDLPGDLCRVQVIAKVPFLSVGDAQVSRRLYLPGGDVWYAVQAIRDVVQMTGRAVRSKEDWAVTYILDEQFTGNLWRKYKHLFPQWWKDSLVMNQSIREYL